MIKPEALLSDLRTVLGHLEVDLRQRANDVPALGESLRLAYQHAKQGERTAQAFETWREEHLTQAAVAWILACVFVRFVEDNGLIDTPLLAGTGLRLEQAKDQRILYFQEHPTDSDREYLCHVFRKVEALPAAAPLFDERHNPLWTFGVSGDGATLLVEFWQRIDPATGVLAHDFADPELNTRFLGDLYQQLSEAARKKYALLQTPEFVEEFILDRTLTPAIAEFGLAEVRLIDPACGSGHFLLGAFARLLDLWQKLEPAVNVRELARRALAAIYGVDLNPYAVAIARFRLLIAALKASDVHRLADAPSFEINLATGDSLLHGPRPGGERQLYLSSDVDPLRHVYDTEDAEQLRRILGMRYHVVVGNPPYIVVKDKALNKAYRSRFGSCYRQYSLVVPFVERFFDLACLQEDQPSGAGFLGMIIGSSFSTHAFGAKLIEQYLPHWELTHIIDSSGAHIPGHGTPTFILFARNREPTTQTIRVARKLKNQVGIPERPSVGTAWLEIVKGVDEPGYVGTYISVADEEREEYAQYPWSLGGIAAAELKEALEQKANATLGQRATWLGFYQDTHADEAFVHDSRWVTRHGLESFFRSHCRGDNLRDWCRRGSEQILFPYDAALNPWQALPLEPRWAAIWCLRTTLWSRMSFSGETYKASKRSWLEFHQFPKKRVAIPLAIAFAATATHNHFVVDPGGTVFNRSAPVIKFPADSTEDDLIAVAGCLNSSVGCFWIKRISHNKGGSGIGRGVQPEDWMDRWDIDTSKLAGFPIPPELPEAVARRLHALGRELPSHLPEALLAGGTLTAEKLSRAKQQVERIIGEMISLQEELDWRCYRAYGLTEHDLSYQGQLPSLSVGQRAFEIQMARDVAGGELNTVWFERHRAEPLEEGPTTWPDEYRELVERRIDVISTNRELGMIEQAKYKRRWNMESWEAQLERAFREWLAGRLEIAEFWSETQLMSVAKVADYARRDDEFMQAATLYKARADFDLMRLVADLVQSDTVPFLPVLRYRDTGIVKRAAWERVWELQRQEDAKARLDDIPAPPKYRAKDFIDSGCWNLRGSLDVPKERFIGYPHAERDADRSLVIGWAGWDYLQQAKALAEYYVRMKEQEGWPPGRLRPLLAGLLELLPWLKQWHNELDPAYGIGMGDYFVGFLDEEARALGFTLEDLRAWQPPAKKSSRRKGAEV